MTTREKSLQRLQEQRSEGHDENLHLSIRSEGPVEITHIAALFAIRHSALTVDNAKPPHAVFLMARLRRWGRRRSLHSEAASAPMRLEISLRPYRTCSRMAASAATGSPDASASASDAWKCGGNGVRRPTTSNNQLRMRTCLRSIIWRTSLEPASSATRM